MVEASLEMRLCKSDMKRLTIKGIFGVAECADYNTVSMKGIEYSTKRGYD